MKTYAKLDSDNYVVAINRGGQHEEGWIEYPSDAPLLGLKRIRLVDGEFITTDQTWEPIPTVDLARKRAYPSIGDQLDALWKAIGPGLDHPEAKAMLRRIQDVKARNPKPSN